MTKTWDVVNEVNPPSIGFVAVCRIRRTEEGSLLCCAATRGLSCGDNAATLASSAPFHFAKRCRRVASGVA
jgi:hypothetical protein